MDTLDIRFSGSGGQGLILAARILASALVAEGRNVAQSQAYEPVSRGGQSRSDLVVSDGEADFPLSSSLDYLLILDEAAAGTSDALLTEGSTVLVDSELVQNPPSGNTNVTALPFTDVARKLGNKRVANIVALGALTASGDICGPEALEISLKSMTPAKFVDLNIEAFEAGQALVTGATT
ncbi:2-oxoacid:acceptor oxidoreductase family protein [Alisedimentitalea sp. MJ-SS2]|uniref:2-oxoacid:acceptor oxidoreductase family protein n=1 Tax=Aliisedimentitalea sp. MJ-SS2 TaxID=3049795 RepID=UPI0029152E17|nr:2-oxoacid:acceptor oxidoreductase family protein [Alisedimentitalea sp. MJ-SS2]MDU8927232.1 2-oxoacid:acceptor oxidoreductase family protein [Alisedimentitalea sp. MJ-SS2]